MSAVSPETPSSPDCLLSIESSSRSVSPSLADDEVEDRRIEVAGARAHHQSLERREAHRRVDRVAADDRARRRAVAEVQRDDLRLLARAAGELAIAIRDVAVRRAVKAVSAHAVAPVELVRDRVEVRGLRQAVMKRRVEHRDLRNAGAEHGARRRDAAEIVRIVQRRELDQLLELAPAPRRRRAWSCVNRSPPCTTRWPTASISPTRRRSPRRTRRSSSQVMTCSTAAAWSRIGAVVFVGAGLGARQRDDRLAADALDLAAREAPVARLGDRGAVGVDELELERRRADVENENVHASGTRWTRPRPR